MDEQMYGRTDGRTNGWMGERMDGRRDQPTDRLID